MSHSNLSSVLKSDANVSHLHFINVFDHSSFKEMHKMTLSDFNRTLHFFQIYNLLLSST